MNPSSTRISVTPAAAAASASPSGRRDAQPAIAPFRARRCAPRCARVPPSHGAREHRRAGRRAREIGDPPPLPERHSDAYRDAAVRGLDPAPLGEDRQRLLEARSRRRGTGRGSASRRGRCRRKFRRPSGGSRAAAPRRRPRSRPSRYRERRRRRSPERRRAAPENRSRRRGCRRARRGRAAATDRRRGRSRSAPRARAASSREHGLGAVRGGASTTTRSGGKADKRRVEHRRCRLGIGPSDRRRDRAARVRQRPRPRGRPAGISGSGAGLPPCAADPRRDQRLACRGRTRQQRRRFPTPFAEDPRGGRDTGRTRGGRGTFRRAGAQDRRRARSAPRRAQHALDEPRDPLVAEFGEQNGPRGEQPFPPGQSIRPIADSGHPRSLPPAGALSMKIAADRPPRPATEPALRQRCASL